MKCRLKINDRNTPPRRRLRRPDFPFETPATRALNTRKYIYATYPARLSILAGIKRLPPSAFRASESQNLIRGAPPLSVPSRRSGGEGGG